MDTSPDLKTVDNQTGIRTWMEDGVLYNEVTAQITLSTIISMQTDSLKLIEQQHINLVPNVIVVKGMGKGDVKLSLADFGKIMTTVDIMKHLSGIWVVGSTRSHERAGRIFNKFFMSGRLHFVDTLEQAEAAARQSISSTNSVLE